MRVVSDIHLHSRFSRAVSSQMVIPTIAEWARKKGIDLVATGDWTHPVWFRELKANLEEAGSGVYKLSGQEGDTPLFLLSTELSSIYTQGGETRRIHNLVFAPDFETVEKINKEFTRRGVNLLSDGRPIMGLSAKMIAEIVLGINEKCLIIPAHCLLPDSYLEVNSGIKKIKDIQVGDKVLTHNGRYKPVREVFTRYHKGKVFWVRPCYFGLGLITTPEHPFLAIKTFKKCRSTGGICRPVGKHLNYCTARHYEAYKKEWIPASKLESGDIILFPRFSEVRDKNNLTISKVFKEVVKEKNGRVSAGGTRRTLIPNEIPINNEFLKLVGYYLAEGYTGGDDISFAFHRSEKEVVGDIKAQMRKLFGVSHAREYRRKNIKGVELIFHSKVLSRLFSKLFYEPGRPRRANAKRLPSWMLYLPPAKQKEILKGWWIGDKGYTSSQVLFNQMKTICLRLGIIPSARVDTKENHKERGKHDRFDNREIEARHDNFVIDKLSFIEDKYSLSDEPIFSKFRTKMERRRGWMDEKYAYLPIRKIERFSYSGQVYNLEVEGDNSYTSEFATVHNCWTPWFSLYGSKSGFDSIEECFGEFAPNIYAVETGLSSDAAMNWRIGELANRRIVSFSDAHSPPKLGREATVFEFKGRRPEVSYQLIREAITGLTSKNQPPRAKIAYTIEFYPEEGKYHFTGHRKCKVVYSPKETRKMGTVCPVCGKPLTVGVMSRVESLASQDVEIETEKDTRGVQWVKDKEGKRPPYVMLVPLLEIISEAVSSGVGSQKVLNIYEQLVNSFGSEFKTLLETPIEEIERITRDRVAEGIKKVRSGDIVIEPGYDGVFGKVKIWKEEEAGEEEHADQTTLF